MDRWAAEQREWIVLENRDSKQDSKLSGGAGQVWEITVCELTMKNILDPILGGGWKWVCLTEGKSVCLPREPWALMWSCVPESHLSCHDTPLAIFERG